MKFKENWPRGFRGEVIRMCGRRQKDRRMDNERQMVSDHNSSF